VEPDAAPSSKERPLPPSILIDASVSRGGRDGKPRVTVNARGGTPVPWTVTEEGRRPLDFDAGAVASEVRRVDVWKKSDDEPGTVRLGVVLHDLPADLLFMELVTGESELVWADGSRGGFRGMHGQYPSKAGWLLDFLTTVPPGDPAIRSASVAVDIHRSVRVRRYEAAVGVGEAAVFDFGNSGSRWILPEDLEVTEFEVRRYAAPLIPLLERGLAPTRFVTLVDATGAVLDDRGSSGGGSVCIRNWGYWPERALVPPLRVAVDLPLETETARVVLRLENLRPTR